MRTSDLAAHLGVSYRQLDYLTRRPDAALTNADLGANGSGTRRTWPAAVVARLEVAVALAAATPGPEASSTFPALADAVIAWTGIVPMAGWALLTEAGHVTIADEPVDLLDAIEASGGGLVVRYELSDAVLDALLTETPELVPA